MYFIRPLVYAWWRSRKVERGLGYSLSHVRHVQVGGHKSCVFTSQLISAELPGVSVWCMLYIPSFPLAHEGPSCDQEGLGSHQGIAMTW
jgi:hypothetical protein